MAEQVAIFSPLLPLVRLEPEVGLEPTTYRLQGGCSMPFTASTCNHSHGTGLTRPHEPRAATPVRTTFDATAPHEDVGEIVDQFPAPLADRYQPS